MSRTLLITTELGEDVDDPSRPRFGAQAKIEAAEQKLALAIHLEHSILVDFARAR